MRGRGAALAVLALAVLFPVVAGEYLLSIAVRILIFAFMGQAWNILGGYAGQLSLGHAAFAGLGAYTSVVLALHAGVTPWIGMFVGAAGAALLSLGIGSLSFRFGVRGVYFALLTIAFAEILRLLASWSERLRPPWGEALGGPRGIFIPFREDPGMFMFRGNVPYYFVALGLFVVAQGIVAWMAQAKLGRYLVAIREDEDAAEAFGVDTFRYKLYAFAISAALTAMGGTFIAYRLFHIGPEESFGFLLSIEMILRPIVGGNGTLWGPLVGSLILTPVGDFARAYLAKGGLFGIHLVFYGAVLVAVVLFLPQGVYPWLRRWWDASRARRRGQP